MPYAGQNAWHAHILDRFSSTKTSDNLSGRWWQTGSRQCVKLHLRDGRTDGQTPRGVCPSVGLSRVAATSTRRDGGDRGGPRCCACLSVRPSVRFKLHLRDGRTDSLSVCLLDGVWHNRRYRLPERLYGCCLHCRTCAREKSLNLEILLLHTDVSVRACTSCRPFLITSKSCWILLLSTVSYRKHLF